MTVSESPNKTKNSFGAATQRTVCSLSTCTFLIGFGCLFFFNETCSYQDKKQVRTLIRKPFPSLEAKQYQVLIHAFRPLFIML